MKIVVLAVALLAIAVAATTLGGEEPTAVEPKKQLVVGVYDSRAIAVAYAPSEWNRKYLEGVRARMEGAKAKNDTAKMREINAEMVRRQQEFHLMAFGTDSVRGLLEPVADRIPGVAKETGVDLIVSRWEVAWRNPDLKVVDVTLPMVGLYNPSEKTLGIVAELASRAPVPRDTLLKMKATD